MHRHSGRFRGEPCCCRELVRPQSPTGSRGRASNSGIPSMRVVICVGVAGGASSGRTASMPEVPGCRAAHHLARSPPSLDQPITRGSLRRCLSQCRRLCPGVRRERWPSCEHVHDCPSCQLRWQQDASSRAIRHAQRVPFLPHYRQTRGLRNAQSSVFLQANAAMFSSPAFGTALMVRRYAGRHLSAVNCPHQPRLPVA